jgi:hypothetical protein
MPNSKQRQKHKDAIDAARCNLELAQMVLEAMPDGLQELDSAKTQVNEALLACCRLSLELGLRDTLPTFSQRPHLSLVLSQEKAG